MVAALPGKAKAWTADVDQFCCTLARKRLHAGHVYFKLAVNAIYGVYPRHHGKQRRDVADGAIRSEGDLCHLHTHPL